MQTETIGLYLTKTGQEAFRVLKTTLDSGKVLYRYNGKHGGGCGIWPTSNVKSMSRSLLAVTLKPLSHLDNSAKRPPGRPSTGQSINLTVRISPELRAQLEALRQWQRDARDSQRSSYRTRYGSENRSRTTRPTARYGACATRVNPSFHRTSGVECNRHMPKIALNRAVCQRSQKGGGFACAQRHWPGEIVQFS